ncbi:unnamed protein product [Clonostachys rosea]|uniref:Xylanolytic transcriptional activator regulatory domain-containing protein n=1 Tax=Bionectria ochroleuca TaxID=29856 RepID=A0ABY6UMU5_BIOOC|nr:unnamed protein product [Clonostachys rosea]
MQLKFAGLDDRLGNIENAIAGIKPLLASLASIVEMRPQTSTLVPQQKSPQSESRCASSITTTISPQLHNMTPQNIFPPVHTLLFAADVYFRFCHNQPYSLFHEATLRHRLASGQVPTYLAWAILAAARRFSSLPDLHESISEDPLSLTKLAWDSLDLPWEGAKNDQEAVAIIQTIVLLVNIEHPAGNCASSYMKLGFALRIALHSRLNLDPEDDLPPVFREERKRAFWSAYLQDKLISLSRERSPVLLDEVCRISLPCSEFAFRDSLQEDCPTLDCFNGERVDEKAAEQCCPLALIFVIGSALNRVSNYALHENRFSELGLPWSPSSPYTSISASLLQLEVNFGLNDPTEEALGRLVNGSADQQMKGSFIYAKAMFHLSHCLLHHPFLLHQRLQRLQQRAPASFAKAAWETCRMHAKSITGLKDLRSQNVLILPSLYGYCTMIAGTIHALCLSDGDLAISSEANIHFKYAVDFLHDLARYWAHAGLMATRLERFRRSVEGKPLLSYTRKEHSGMLPVDAKTLWQSVDYALLSTPTRPGSPSLQTEAIQTADFDFSPSQLFDFPVPDFGGMQNVDMGDFEGLISLDEGDMVA